MMHFHRWGKWEDVSVKDIVDGVTINPSRTIFFKQIIVQQRRCSTCNLVKTRHS